MTIPSPAWINALKLPTKIIAGLFVAALVMLILHYYAALDLTVLGAHAAVIVLMAAIVFGSITVTSFAAFIAEPLLHRRKLTGLKARRAIRQEETDAQRKVFEAAAIDRLDYLSDDEIRYAADCLRKNEQSFLGYVYHGPISNLIAKGLVSTPGGTHNQDHYPYYFLDFAWKALLARKEQVLARDDDRQKREAESKKGRRF